MSPWVFLAGAVAATAVLGGTFMGGVKVGRAYESNTTLKANLKQSNLVRIQQERVIVEVPKIVTKVVTRETHVVKEVERVIVASENVLAADCVLPDNYGMLLVAAANGVDPTPAGGADAFRGEYGCREVLAATLADLLAGWRNTARLEGLQEWAKLVTEEK